MSNTTRTVLLVVLGVVIVCCGGGILIVTTATGRAANSDKEALAAAKALGMPVEPEDLQRPAVPPGQNAAPIYTNLARLFAGPLDATQKELSLGLGKKATDKQRRDAEAALLALLPTLDQANAIDKKPGCNFERKWSLGQALLLPEYAGMKALVKDYVYQANQLDSKGDQAGSRQALARAYRVMNDADTDPILISMLVNIACHAIINRELETLIQRHSSDSGYLSQVQAEIQSYIKLPDARIHLGGEIVMGRITIRTMHGLVDIEGYDGMGPPPEPSPFERDIFTSPLMKQTFDERLLWAWRLAWVEFPKDSQDWAGFGVAMKHMDNQIQKDSSLGNTLNRILMPVFDQAIDAIGKTQAHDRMLLTSIAILKSRNATGSLPRVTPESLGQIRIDPFDGNPLRYKKTAGGFIVYSIGSDRVDNGGHVRSSHDPEGTGYDEVVEFN